MGIASVPSIKKLVTGTTILQLEKLANAVVNMSTASEVEDYLRRELASVL